MDKKLTKIQELEKRIEDLEKYNGYRYFQDTFHVHDFVQRFDGIRICKLCGYVLHEFPSKSFDNSLEKFDTPNASSTIDILDTIEKWCEGEKYNERKTKNLGDWTVETYKEKMLVNATLTLVQDFIKQTKKEIQ